MIAPAVKFFVVFGIIMSAAFYLGTLTETNAAMLGGALTHFLDYLNYLSPFLHVETIFNAIRIFLGFILSLITFKIVLYVSGKMAQ